MVRKLSAPVLALGLVAVACGAPDIIVRPGGEGEVRFFPQVVDAEGNVGAGLSMAVGAEGNPHFSYLAFEEEPEPGEPAPIPDPEAPEFPAVLHGHIVENARTKSTVAEDTGVTQEDRTAIAVDQDGVYHVAWTEDGALLYSSTAEGDFSEPEEIAAGDIVGPSITMEGVEGSAPLVAFSVGTGVEGPGGLVRVAARDEDGWTVETAAEADQPGQTSIITAPGQGTLVAYGSDGQTRLARRSGDAWTSETVDPEGGVGVDLAVDMEGHNPHLAYTTEAGAVKHAHSIDGGAWEISDVADGAVSDRGGATIALDEEGVHHIAWPSEAGIGYASNAEGEFANEEVPAAVGGELPQLGIGAEGIVLLAWFDPEGTEVQLAPRSDDPPLLALPEAPTAGPASPPPLPTGPPPCQPEGTDVQIVAPLGAVSEGFAEDCYGVPAGEAFTINFDNQDENQIHNVNIYTDSSAQESLLQEPLAGGIPGPDSTTYDGEPIEDPGQYFFQCDYHITTMTGTFVVAEGGG